MLIAFIMIVQVVDAVHGRGSFIFLQLWALGRAARADVLDAVGAVWRRHAQNVTIVLDKLMQYQIVEPADVVAWAFGRAPGLDAREWALVRAALDKANGRVGIARRKVAAVRRDEDDARAKEKALAAGGMEVDGDGARMAMHVPRLICIQNHRHRLSRSRRRSRQR